MLVYYAHCQAIYGTPQEDRDIALLEKLGFEVVNPAKFDSDDMEFYCNLGIPLGVAKELFVADEENLPIIELPNFSGKKVLDLASTRKYLQEIGQR